MKRSYIGEIDGVSIYADPMCQPDVIYYVRGEVLGASVRELKRLLDDEPDFLRELIADFRDQL